MSLPPEELARLVKIGPAAARLEVATTDLHGSTPHSVRKGLVIDWANAEESRLAAESEARREAREEDIRSSAKEALSIAKDANRIASSALAASRSTSRWAMYAAIVATIALAISIREDILALIARLL